jgi:uncharacterized protein with HEPN domain
LKPDERDQILYLEHIVLSMQRVAEYISDLDFQHFKQDYKTVDAVIRNFEIIGEASNNVSEEIKLKYPQVPWKEMYRLRNRISHEYFGIDYEIIWNIVAKHLPLNLEDLIKIVEIEQSNNQ